MKNYKRIFNRKKSGSVSEYGRFKTYYNLKVFVIILLLFFAFGMPRSPHAESHTEQIVMACMLPEDSYQGKWMKLVYTEAFHRLGKELMYKFIPAKRASYMSDKGIVDGDLFRAYKYGDSHPELVRVEESVYTTTVAAFATDSSIKLDGWESLKGTGYRVEYRRGIKLCENALPAVVEKERLSDISHWTSGLRKLASGRSDIYVDVEDIVMKELKNDSSGKFSLIYKVGVMEIAPVHAYFHKKHKVLASDISAILKQMKQEGMIKRYREMITE